MNKNNDILGKFSGAKKKKSEEGRPESTPAPTQEVVVVPVKKVGRPTNKDMENHTYVKLSVKVKEEVLDKLKKVIVFEHKGQTQDEVVEHVLENYLKDFDVDVSLKKKK